MLKAICPEGPEFRVQCSGFKVKGFKGRTREEGIVKREKDQGLRIKD
jgi:hypothetical protein